MLVKHEKYSIENIDFKTIVVYVAMELLATDTYLKNMMGKRYRDTETKTCHSYLILSF